MVSCELYSAYPTFNTNPQKALERQGPGKFRKAWNLRKNDDGKLQKPPEPKSLSSKL